MAVRTALQYLAGGRMLPVLEVLDRPVITSVTEKMTHEYPEAFPACVLTRAQTRKMGTEFTLDDMFMCTDDDVISAGKCRSQEARNEKVSSSCLVLFVCFFICS